MKNIISIDTDGIYSSKKIDIEKLNKYLDIKSKEIFNIDKNYLHMEIDHFDAGFFRETKGKHYILKNSDKIKFAGQSFKGSHMPQFFNEILEKAAKELFDGKEFSKVDIRSFPIESLIQSIKVKDEESYKSNSSLSMQLINAAKREMPDIELTDNDQLSYIKTFSGYELVLPGKQYKNIDYKYYEGIIDKIYERLKYNKSKQVRFEV